MARTVNKRKSKNDTFYFLLGGMGIFVVFVVILLSGDQGLFHLIKLKNKKADLIEENRQLQFENLKLKMEIKALDDIDYLEKEIRKTLPLAYENEIIYVLPENEK